MNSSQSITLLEYYKQKKQKPIKINTENNAQLDTNKENLRKPHESIHLFLKKILCFFVFVL